MSIQKGDFIGFTFNGVHSSTLGIIRTDNGGRYTEGLLPSSQDKTVQVPGADGTYYFGSYYTQRNFAISIAFDSVTEKQLSLIKRLFGDKQVHELIFDELPYKIYRAKVTGMATIKYICFNEGSTHRLYKGEGDIQFTAFSPFARASKKFLNLYSDYNKQEWAAASGMLEKQGDYDILKGNKIPLYNPGDIPSNWTLKVSFLNTPLGKRIPNTSIVIGNQQLKINKIEPKSNIKGELDTFIKIESATNLIEGYYLTVDGKERKSGNIYNDAITAGEFFQIPCNEYKDGSLVPCFMTFENGNDFVNNLPKNALTYDYYYL